MVLAHSPRNASYELPKENSNVNASALVNAVIPAKTALATATALLKRRKKSKPRMGLNTNANANANVNPTFSNKRILL